MEKKLKSKKAFTLTELIVVIAIIGILSVVIIPVLTGCIEDAKVSNDTVLVANINKALSANKILDGRNDTAYDAINDAFEAGYGVEKLTPTANKCYFMWDAKYDEFVLVNESYGEIFPQDKGTRARENLFALVGDHDNATKLTKLGFSIYLRKEYNDSTELVINAGLDVGEETNISSIRYEENKEINKSKDKDVIIRTNGGTLTIDAKQDTVKHYGMSDTVTVMAIANNSYHEFGYVIMLKVASGRIVVEDTPATKINSIFITKASDGTNDGVEIKMPQSIKQIIEKEKGLPNTQKITINEKIPSNSELPEKDELEAKQVAITSYLNKVLLEDRAKIKDIDDSVIEDQIDCWADETNMLAYKVFYFLTKKGYSLSKLNDQLFVNNKGGVFIYKGNSEIGTIIYYGNPLEDKEVVDLDIEGFINNSFLFVSEEGGNGYWSCNYLIVKQIQNALHVNFPNGAE